MRKLKKNYNRKNNSVLSMSVCWCPCQGAQCVCSDAHTQNYKTYQNLVNNSQYSTQMANYS